MKDLWATSVLSACEPLSKSSLDALHKRMMREEQREAKARYERAEAFWNTIPEHLKEHPLVHAVGYYVTCAVPMHPAFYAQFQALIESEG